MYSKEILVLKNNNQKMKGKHALNQKQVFLRQGNWQQSKMHLVCQLIQEWRVQQLQLEANKHSTILHEIYCLKLPSLKVLDLSINKIESIECIYRLQIPQVKELYFYRNHLLSIKGLRKAHFPHLTFLNLERNQVKDLQLLSQFCLQQIQGISVDSYPKYTQGENPKWMAKLQMVKPNRIYIDSKKRISFAPFKELMNRKYEDLVLFCKI